MVKIEFNTGNAAFEDGSDMYEIARILYNLADKAENGNFSSGKIMDINGNGVGTYEYEES